MSIKRQKTKTLTVKLNGRSSDFVTPNFIYGCEASCKYCYIKRWDRSHIYMNENIDDILKAIKKHSLSLGRKVPNQVDSKYHTYDIACSTDVTLYWNKYPFDKVLRFFQDNNIKSTFATKFVNKSMLDFKANEQNRIRFSIMPQDIANIIQPKVTKEIDKVMAINYAKDKGWDVHINFSPVVYYNGWKEDYADLFSRIDKLVKRKDNVSCEVIFLTHHEGLHKLNMKDEPHAEEILWRPEIQETKVSNYGGRNIRYERNLKKEFISEFKDLHAKYIPWCSIRYIF